MELYNDSLRYAEPKSEHISLANANRAACFLSLKVCLKDIELAKDAGYPDHLMPKLEKRKEMCLKQQLDDPQSQRPLNVVPNEQFPYLTGAAEIRKMKSGEHLIVAKADIDVGEIVDVEKAFQVFRTEDFSLKYSMCLNEYCSLVPCENCADALFCPDCHEDRSLHDYECGVNDCGKGVFYMSTMSFVRSILQLLKLFANADELMEYVEYSQSHPNELPANLMDERSKYQIVLSKLNHLQLDEWHQMIYFKCLARIARRNPMVRRHLKGWV